MKNDNLLSMLGASLATILVALIAADINAAYEALPMFAAYTFFGSPICWTGRLVPYTGAVCLLIGFLVVRKSKASNGKALVDGFDADSQKRISELEQLNSLLRQMIAEHQQAETALQKSQCLLKETERIGKVGGWEIDIQTGSQAWTEEVYNIHEVNYTCNPTVQMGIEFYTPASRPIIERAVQRAIESGEPFDEELEIVTAKGNLRNVHAIGKADPKNNTIYGFFQDITERKRAEKQLFETLHQLEFHRAELEMQNEELRRTQFELERSQARFIDLYDLAPVGYLTINEQGLVIEANLTVVAMLGTPRESLIKRPFSLYIFADDQDAFYLYRRRLLKNPASHSCELRIRKMDDSVQFWVQMDAVSIQGKENEYEFRIIVSDISVRKQLADEVIRALDAAKSSNATMTRLLRTVAHEFRSPLGLLAGSTDILDRYWDRLTPEKRLEQNDHIRSAARQMSNLINSIISLNRAGDDCSGNELRLLNIKHICSAIAAEVEAAWGAGHTCMVTIADDCGSAVMDEMLFRRILENLLTNAFRYTLPEGTLTLDVSRLRGLLLIEVSDTGIGIPEEDQPQIFDAFYRSGNVESRRGLGLGLSIVQEALLMMGGTIAVASRIGEGTVMRVEIPVAHPETITGE